MVSHNHVVFFDGVCALCNLSVDILLKIDKRDVLKFASLQGESAKSFLDPKTCESMESLVFFKDGHSYLKSTAVQEILISLGGFSKFLGLILKLIPRFIKDYVYNLISRHRYKIFGKKKTCRLPTPKTLGAITQMVKMCVKSKR